MNQYDLQGRIRVITGGSGGIGYAIAERFAACGAKFVLWDINADAAKTAAHTLGAQLGLGMGVDVTNASSVAEAAARVQSQLGSFDVLVNAAGINGPIGPVETYSVDAWRQVLDVNLTGVFICCREALPYLRKARNGRVVNLSSVGGKEGNPNQGAYGASKAG